MPTTAPHIELLPIAALKPWPRNARTHSNKQLRQIADSIRTFGFTAPVLVDGENGILAGHGRVAAAKLVGMTEVPCVRLAHLSEAQRRAYVLADNKLTLNSDWDEQLLAEELQLILAIPEISLEVTGFSVPEIDLLIEGLGISEPGDPRDDALPPKSKVRRCQPGDVWALGLHRLVCGDARDPKVVETLMAGETAQMVFTDPPYDLRINAVSGLGRVKHREFAMASGEMGPAEFTAFLRSAFENLVRFSANGAIAFVCMDWRHQREILDAADGVFGELENLIVWVKDNGGMGSFYRSRHELVYAFRAGTAAHINNFELGQHGRYRTNVWEYRGASSASASRAAELAMHPTVKPVAMIADAIKDVSERGGIVLDLFGGSGSTLIAAHKTGRRARLVEIDPLYCDTILARYEAYAHDEAHLLSRTAADTPGAASTDDLFGAANAMPAQKPETP